MPEFKDYNDYELLDMIKDKSEIAEEIIFQKYKSVIDLKSAKFIKLVEGSGVDYSDLVQEGMIGLTEAIRDYNSKNDVKFYTFASLCIERQIVSALVKAKRYKYKVLNDSLSLDYVNEDSENTFGKYVMVDEHSNPEEYIMTHEFEKNIDEKTKTRLTDLEKQIYELKKSGFTNKEMAELLEKDYKAIDNAMQRIKTKMKQIMKEER